MNYRNKSGHEDKWIVINSKNNQGNCTIDKQNSLEV